MKPSIEPAPPAGRLARDRDELASRIERYASPDGGCGRVHPRLAFFRAEAPEPRLSMVYDPALLLVQRIRDEAHRFAVTFHRKARTMRDLRSALDDVPGIGPRRRRALLTAFGSLAGVRRATREELSAVVGAKAATAVIDYFAQTH